MSIIGIKGDTSPAGILRHWERKTKPECAREILRCWTERDDQRKRLEQLEARAADLEQVAIRIRRDLMIRAEPDWDGSGQRVVNLSASIWEDLNRVLEVNGNRRENI